MSLTPRADRQERNLLINGGMATWQRAGASSAVNTSTSLSYVGPDRWKVMHTGTFTGTPNIVRDTTVPDAAFASSLKHSFQRNASSATLTYEQRVESNLSAHLSVLGRASLSFYVRSTVAGSIVVTLYTPTVQDNHASQTQIYLSSSQAVSANTWTLISLANIAIPSSANLGLAVNIQYVMASGTDGSAQSFWLTRAMLNEGATAADFQRFGGSHISEIAACQRYYEKSYDINTPVSTAVTAGSASSGRLAGGNNLSSVNFKVLKRGTPSATLYSPVSGAANTVYDQTVGISDAMGSTAPSESGITQIAVGVARAVNNIVLFQWVAELEL